MILKKPLVPAGNIALHGRHCKQTIFGGQGQTIK